MIEHEVVIRLKVKTPMDPTQIASFYCQIVSELEGTEHCTTAVSVRVDDKDVLS